MQLTTNNNVNFKTAAKNLAKSLKSFDLNLTHSTSLNIMAQALGYPNYNTYKPIMEKQEEESIFPMKYLSDVEVPKLKSIYENFVEIRFNEISDINEKYRTFIREEDDNYYLMFSLKKQHITDRVFFVPEYFSFSLFVYPTIEEGANDYSFSLREEKNTDAHMLKMIHHLSMKTWFVNELLEYLIALYNMIIVDMETITNLSSHIDKKRLQKLFLEKKQGSRDE